ncbi:hypothetical protein [Vibrio quintilis]|uniref:Uncharacterized protein n=1 Tax=Vibrio quintilis TaxID=1117707 RepID=A0A1M7YQ29_9VIBR|nr:hypothetical protein [Vibrio quintilis]SHO54739.1 hypothetical protein VQ7734_00457 [Vibrio quintilis]
MKKYILLILCTGLLWAYYFFPIPQPNKKLPESLLNLNQVMINQTPNTSKVFKDYWINELSNKKQLSHVEKQMINLADKAGIHRIIFGYSAAFRIAYFTNYSNYYLTNRYYVYSSDDSTEETQVPSIDQAIAQLKDKSIYYFCEPADHPHWFVCAGED